MSTTNNIVNLMLIYQNQNKLVHRTNRNLVSTQFSQHCLTFLLFIFYMIHIFDVYYVIVPDQKVTAGALDVVVATVVECVGMLVGADGGVYLQALRRSSQ
jgi:uncharacterized BrkB/YihY/UPF0761 family membrane protein